MSWNDLIGCVRFYNRNNFPIFLPQRQRDTTIVYAIGKKMYSDFKTQAIEYVKQAVQEDNARNYAKAFPLYMNALEYFKIHLKYETNPKIKEAITQKFTEYLNRAEEIRAILDYKGGSGPTSSNWDVAVATQPKTKPPEGEGGDGEDPEHAKLKEKQNNDVVGLESAKQEAMILPITGSLASFIIVSC